MAPSYTVKSCAIRLFLAIFPLLLWGCAEKEFDPNDAEKSYGIAKDPYDDGAYEIAVQKLGEFKARFPYSKFAVESELLIANAHYELGHFTEAAVAYEQFVKLHPKHPKIDFAMFRIGEAYWEDAPDDIDREQEFTTRAVREWEKLIAKLPESPYSKKAVVLVAEGKRRIAESIAFIFRFYCKQDLPHACAYRAIQLADEYPDLFELRVDALENAIEALEKVAVLKEKDPASDKNLFFKTMSAAEIRTKADNLRRGLADYKKSLGKT